MLLPKVSTLETAYIVARLMVYPILVISLFSADVFQQTMKRSGRKSRKRKPKVVPTPFTLVY